MWSLEWTDTTGRHHFKMVRNHSVAKSYTNLLSAQGIKVDIMAVQNAARNT